MIFPSQLGKFLRTLGTFSFSLMLFKPYKKYFLSNLYMSASEIFNKAFAFLSS